MKKRLHAICHQGLEVAGIVEDLLVASRAELGELAVVSVPVHLQAQAAQVWAHWFDQPILADTTEERVRALGDPLRVRQIVRNLVRNALLYGGGNIAIEVGAYSSTSVYLSVKDNGDGLSTEDQQRMFQPFERGDHDFAPLGSVGLGLTVSRHLAQLMEGDLTYRYEQGESIFTLSLPTAPATNHLTPQSVSQSIPA